LRRIDSCGRIGGEEFLVVLPETDRTEALATAERLRAAIADQSAEHEGQSLRVTASIGVATRLTNAPILTAEKLIQCADQALYIAKDTGRNRVVMT
jgi:diguanylate cyclase (GGDEF)-like protein